MRRTNEKRAGSKPSRYSLHRMPARHDRTMCAAFSAWVQQELDAMTGLPGIYDADALEWHDCGITCPSCGKPAAHSADSCTGPYGIAICTTCHALATKAHQWRNLEERRYGTA